MFCACFVKNLVPYIFILVTLAFSLSIRLNVGGVVVSAEIVNSIRLEVLVV